ncbi:hypothetical protein Pcinc_044080 [Petrolisthes cinctipes]|uniref:Uncharacterized protein n=1 Tax=Petrolisthes cinctipes TaxID=88211 RepID=A0AAE1BEU9_PETCI|nr:hypothetical protein Pcinc_044080 [Petrolisthes cinctipes]
MAHLEVCPQPWLPCEWTKEAGASWLTLTEEENVDSISSKSQPLSSLAIGFHPDLTHLHRDSGTTRRCCSRTTIHPQHSQPDMIITTMSERFLYT